MHASPQSVFTSTTFPPQTRPAQHFLRVCALGKIGVHIDDSSNEAVKCKKYLNRLGHKRAKQVIRWKKRVL